MTHRNNHILRGVTGVILLGLFMTMTTGCSRLSKLVSDIEALEDVDYQKVEQTLEHSEMGNYLEDELIQEHEEGVCDHNQYQHRQVYKTVNNTDNDETNNYNTYNYNSYYNENDVIVEYDNEAPVEGTYTPEEIIVAEIQVMEEVLMIPAVVDQEVVYVEPVEAAEVDMDINIDIDIEINSESASEEPIIEDEAAHHPEVID